MTNEKLGEMKSALLIMGARARLLGRACSRRLKTNPGPVMQSRFGARSLAVRAPADRGQMRESIYMQIPTCLHNGQRSARGQSARARGQV